MSSVYKSRINLLEKKHETFYTYISVCFNIHIFAEWLTARPTDKVNYILDAHWHRESTKKSAVYPNIFPLALRIYRRTDKQSEHRVASLLIRENKNEWERKRKRRK